MQHNDLGGTKGPALLADALGLQPNETPFPWQVNLLQRFLDGDLPRSLDVPTGLGKTATIAIWLVARALGASVPRRLVYVVDRRAVVDQATTVAAGLREWVSDKGLGESLSLGGRRLAVSTLRGQLVDKRAWLDDPTAPAIIVGTVDMVGSRLLFEGYGASRKIRPYMAGLLGHDTLFVIDEAHLVPPFEQLLERAVVRRDGLGPEGPTAVELPPARLLSLSATGRSHGGETFDLDDDDLAHPIVQKRLDAEKRLALEPVDAKADLVETIAARAWALGAEGSTPARCIVFVNRREQAEKICALLGARAGLDKRGKAEPTADVDLLVGARRVFEREESAKRLAELGFLAGTAVARARPAFLVCTSAGEVGVDLDADHMVCDLVLWERMVQRLGRVNRRGERHARVLVIDQPEADEALEARRAQVRALIGALPATEAGHDASPGALRALQRAAKTDEALARRIADASTEAPHYPGLDRPTLDAWSMTSLKHHPGRPVVAPWLRGWIEDRPQTSVAWRLRFPLVSEGDGPRSVDARKPSREVTARYLEAVPIHRSEVLETTSSRVSEWLGKRVKRCLKRAEKNPEEPGIRPDTVVALIERGDDDSTWWTLRELDAAPKKRIDRELSGASLLVDARLGGLSHGLLDDAGDEAPLTLDDDAWHAEVEPGYRTRQTDAPDATSDDGWRERERFPIALGADGEVTRWLVVDKRRVTASTEDDRSAGPPQSLDEHHAWTEEMAREIATRLELPAAARRVLEIAARLHDEGKRAPRWQRAFSAHLIAPPPEGPYAKTPGPLNVRMLDGYRHELGSIPRAEADPEVAALSDDDRDLVLHLIASHHGFARPVISTKGCEDAPPSALEARASEIARRFLRLQRRWGPWGLAWWEALLRSADQQASRRNDQRDRTPRGDR